MVMTINLLGYLLAFWLLQELLRRYQWVSWFTFALLPIILLPWWLRYSEQVADGPYRDLYWDTPLAWIVGYTSWNLVFIYDYSPQTVGSHAVILGAALLVALINRKRWMQARVINLFAWLFWDLPIDRYLSRLVVLSTRMSSGY